jgi:hypothetical protein
MKNKAPFVRTADFLRRKNDRTKGSKRAEKKRKKALRN